jgi:hypothetical protein
MPCFSILEKFDIFGRFVERAINTQKSGTSSFTKRQKKSRSSPAQQHVDTKAPAPQSTTSSLDGRQHRHQSQHQLCRHIDNVISACYGPGDLSITHRCIDGKKMNNPKLIFPAICSGR